MKIYKFDQELSLDTIDDIEQKLIDIKNDNLGLVYVQIDNLELFTLNNVNYIGMREDNNKYKFVFIIDQDDNSIKPKVADFGVVVVDSHIYELSPDIRITNNPLEINVVLQYIKGVKTYVKVYSLNSTTHIQVT